MYCEKCKRMIETDRCPVCKRSKVREPNADDLCLLADLDYLSSGMLEDVLRQNGIPFLKKGVLGAGLAIKVGPMLDRSRFYVLYGELDNARTVMEDLFAIPPEGAEEGEGEE